MRSFVLQEKSGESAGGQDFCWDHEHQAVGHGDQAAADEDVGFAIGVVRADQLIAEAERAAEIGGPGFFGDEGIGSGFDDAVLDVFGAEDAAEIAARIRRECIRLRRRGGGLRG